MIPNGALPGFVARVGSLPDTTPASTAVGCGEVTLGYWGLSPLADETTVLALSRIRRTTAGSVDDASIASSMRASSTELMSLLPPFAAVAASSDSVRMLADSMGFRQLYHTEPGATGTPLLATSALSIAQVRDCHLDETGVAVQSLLGWQLGQRTIFSKVTKLAPRTVAELRAEGVRLLEPEVAEATSFDLDDAVTSAARLLRQSLGALLDDHPDAVLQLTGGQDSRILLSAVPPSRRRGLRAMTLGVPGGGDVDVAARIAATYGLAHEVHGLVDLQSLSPDEAWEYARSAAVRLDGMSDPIALAALGVGESRFDQGVRISGLGGEVARGFYYVGKVKDRPYTKRDAEQLAAWRMFVNEAVEPDMLRPEFAAWARETANAEVYAALLAGGPEWFRATDNLYLRHRMQRWAGVTDTAVAYERMVINPMLDEGFLRIAAGLQPHSKAHSLFLARLQMELDPGLGRVPLEGRPAPQSYAHPTPLNAVTGTYGQARKMGRKLVQRLRRTNRPPAGGDLLASKVVAYWRQVPTAVTECRFLNIIRDEWIADVLASRVEPRPSSVALLVNLIVAGQTEGTP